MVEATITGLPFVPLQNAFEIISFLDECYDDHCRLNASTIAQFVYLSLKFSYYF
jgi:hypothetical protein